MGCHRKKVITWAVGATWEKTGLKRKENMSIYINNFRRGQHRNDKGDGKKVESKLDS